MIAATLVMMVCVILVAAATQLAIHSTQRSGLSRNRSASLHAAEAGIEAALSAMTVSSGCPTAGSEVALPDQNQPTESYKILTPVACTPGGSAIIAAVGYVPNAAQANATTTIVAHVNRGQGAPVSGFGTNGTQSCPTPSQCGYVFPDALFSGGSIGTSGGTLSAYGTGGTVPNVVANGNIDITGSQLDGLVHSWGTVNLNVPAVGGEVAGTSVTLTGATVQSGSGGVVATADLSLTNSTVNGNATYGGSLSSNNSLVTGSKTHASPAPSLQSKRLMPTFTDNPTDIQNILGVGPPTTTLCPGSGTANFYEVTPVVACTYQPATINGTVVLVVHGAGALTVTVPPTTTGGQLYVIDANGVLDSVVVDGTNNSSLPVFVFTDQALTIKGGITGQLLGGSVTTGGATTVTFSPPAIPAPDFAFNSAQVAPGGLGFAASISSEYQCPGATAC